MIVDRASVNHEKDMNAMTVEGMNHDQRPLVDRYLQIEVLQSALVSFGRCLLPTAMSPCQRRR